MKNAVELLLTEDHESLDRLLVELQTQLEEADVAASFKLLDLFWARLAIHIRAENLHLFPALTNAPAAAFSGNNNLPTGDEAHDLMLRLRSDHDFFMKELASLIKTMRELSADQPQPNEIKEVRQRLLIIQRRLKVHNHLEEGQAYTWPALIFDEQTVAALCDRMRRELENLPPRFA
jgi:hypothetical protein